MQDLIINNAEAQSSENFSLFEERLKKSNIKYAFTGKTLTAKLEIVDGEDLDTIELKITYRKGVYRGYFEGIGESCKKIAPITAISLFKVNRSLFLDRIAA